MFEKHRFEKDLEDGTHITFTKYSVVWWELFLYSALATLWVHFLLQVWRNLG